jgi:hypothetical protein
MPELVAHTLQRLFDRRASASAQAPQVFAATEFAWHVSDFADVRPPVYRSEAFAEDLLSTHDVA